MGKSFDLALIGQGRMQGRRWTWDSSFFWGEGINNIYARGEEIDTVDIREHVERETVDYI